MPNQVQEHLTTYPKPEKTKDELTNKMVSIQAERIVTNVVFPMVFKSALELGVIDTLAALEDGLWLSPSELALALPTKPTNPEAAVLLDRMLLLLASNSVLKCRVVETLEKGRTGNIDRVYAAEPVYKFFLNRNDDSGSLMSIHVGPNRSLFQVLVHFTNKPNITLNRTHLKDMILEGRDAFSSAHGMKLFEYIGSDQPFAELFNRAMSEASILIMKKVLEVYKGFENVNTLVDVGGGIGTVLDLVITKYPHIKGINFDLPSVLAHAPFYPGIKHVSGDMFTEIPKGDAIFMKWILHDWNDQDCIKILKNCWKSLPINGKVIIVDFVKPTEPKRGICSSDIVCAMDMMMLTQCSGGKERSQIQLETLAYDSGFCSCKVICLAYSYSVIEFRK